MIEESSSGGVDYEDFETKLKVVCEVIVVRTAAILSFTTQYYSDTTRTLIGTFSAASNLTGVMSDTVHISCLLHQYGAMSLWDYATAGVFTYFSLVLLSASHFSTLSQHWHESGHNTVPKFNWHFLSCYLFCFYLEKMLTWHTKMPSSSRCTSLLVA